MSSGRETLLRLLGPALLVREGVAVGLRREEVRDAGGGLRGGFFLGAGESTSGSEMSLSSSYTYLEGEGGGGR